MSEEHRSDAENGDSPSPGEMSEEEFQRVEDRLDGVKPRSEDVYDRLDRLNRPRGVMSMLASPGRRNAGIMLPVVAVFAVASAAALFSNSSSAKVPSCKKGSVSCEETSNGIWVPGWYYGGLVLAQGSGFGAKPSTTGTQPTTAELEESGATASETSEAESYAQSSAADESSGGGDNSGSDDSGGDGGDISGDDGGGGDGGGGDGGDG